METPSLEVKSTRDYRCFLCRIPFKKHDKIYVVNTPKYKDPDLTGPFLFTCTHPHFKEYAAEPDGIIARRIDGSGTLLPNESRPVRVAYHTDCAEAYERDFGEERQGKDRRKPKPLSYSEVDVIFRMTGFTIIPSYPQDVRRHARIRQVLIDKVMGFFPKVKKKLPHELRAMIVDADGGSLVRLCIVTNLRHLRETRYGTSETKPLDIHQDIWAQYIFSESSRYVWDLTNTPPDGKDKEKDGMLCRRVHRGENAPHNAQEALSVLTLEDHLGIRQVILVPSDADLSRFDSDVIANGTRHGLWWRITNARDHEILMAWSDGIKMRSMYARNDPYKVKRIRGRNKQTSPDAHSKTDSQAHRALLLRRNVSTVTSWRDLEAASAYLYGDMAKYVISGNQTPNLRAITFKDHPTMDSFVVNGAGTTGYSSFWCGDKLHVLHAHSEEESQQSSTELYDSAARRHGSGVWMYFPMATAHGERLTDVFGRHGADTSGTRRLCFRTSLGRHWRLGPVPVPGTMDLERQGSHTFPYRPDNDISLGDQIQIDPSQSNVVDETRAVNPNFYSHVFSLPNNPLRIYYDSSSDGGSKMIVHGPQQTNDQKLPSFRFPPPHTALDKSLHYAKYMLSTVSLEGVASVTPSYKMVHYCDPRDIRLCGFLFRYTDPTRPPGVLGEYRLDRVGTPISVANTASGETVDALYFTFKVPPKGSRDKAVLASFSTERAPSKDDLHVYSLPLRGKASAWFSHEHLYIESLNLRKVVLQDDYTGSDKEMVI